MMMVGVEREHIGRRLTLNPIPNCNPNPLSGGIELGFCYYLVYINTGVDSVGGGGGRGGGGEVGRKTKA